MVISDQLDLVRPLCFICIRHCIDELGPYLSILSWDNGTVERGSFVSCSISPFRSLHRSLKLHSKAQRWIDRRRRRAAVVSAVVFATRCEKKNWFLEIKKCNSVSMCFWNLHLCTKDFNKGMTCFWGIGLDPMWWSCPASRTVWDKRWCDPYLHHGLNRR